MWTKTTDGSVIADKKQVIAFSTERFLSDIVLGNFCFICGRSPNDTPFNDEHVIPDWLLRRFNLFNRHVALPNNTTIRYGAYKVPCCVKCNSMMGKNVEEPISKVVAAGGPAIREYIESAEGGQRIFNWMVLLFLKTHLKDRLLRLHRDARKGAGPIGDLYDWSELHHLHTLARVVYTGGAVDGWNVGSLVGLPVVATTVHERFDYLDSHEAQTMLLRLDDIAIIAVLNDAGGAQEFFGNHLSRINGPLAEQQIREVFAELAYLNTRLKERPSFYTEFDLAEEKLRLRVERTEPELLDLSRPERGKYLRFALKPWMGKFQMDGATPAEIEESIAAGTFSTLFNDKGEFMPGATTARPPPKA